MTVKESLSWGLVISTYQRDKILLTSLKLAVEQTQKPTEIIVIDASDNWEETRDKVMVEIAFNQPDIRWIYHSAEKRSSSLQRNQGLQLAKADIVFLLDDDSLMYPNCAEEIMKVYEADTECVIKGVAANSAGKSPVDIAIDDNMRAGSMEKIINFLRIRLLWNLMVKHLMLVRYPETVFIPYEGNYPTYQIPSSVSNLNVITEKLFDGFRMTFRRETILKEQFEPLLFYYAVDEDLDASYRVSRHGLLLTAKNANLYHAYIGSGRLTRFQIALLAVMNQSLFLKKNSNDLQRDKTLFYRLLARQIIGAIIKNLLGRRFTMPCVRGLLSGLKHSHQLFYLPNEELAQWYPNFQKNVIDP